MPLRTITGVIVPPGNVEGRLRLHSGSTANSRSSKQVEEHRFGLVSLMVSERNNLGQRQEPLAA